MNEEIRKKHLTPREAECMQNMINGLTAKQIANALGISYRTVEIHISNIKRKFSSKNRCEAIKYFLTK